MKHRRRFGCERPGVTSPPPTFHIAAVRLELLLTLYAVLTTAVTDGPPRWPAECSVVVSDLRSEPTAVRGNLRAVPATDGAPAGGITVIDTEAGVCVWFNPTRHAPLPPFRLTGLVVRTRCPNCHRMGNVLRSDGDCPGCGSAFRLPDPLDLSNPVPWHIHLDRPSPAS